MSFKGEIEPNFDKLNDFFRALMTRFADGQARLAMWLNQAIDLSPIPFEVIGANSPFPDKKSILAGDGLLINIEPGQVEQLVEIITAEDYFNWNIVHLEIEFNGVTQFAAYDNFECAFFGDQLSLEFLEDLKARGVILGYTRDDDQVSEP